MREAFRIQPSKPWVQCISWDLSDSQGENFMAVVYSDGKCETYRLGGSGAIRLASPTLRQRLLSLGNRFPRIKEQ